MTPPETTRAGTAEHNLLGPVWLVWSNEHEAWWGRNHCGYTTDVTAAGRYMLAEANRICESACRGRCKPSTEAPPEVVCPSPELIAMLLAAPAPTADAPTPVTPPPDCQCGMCVPEPESDGMGGLRPATASPLVSLGQGAYRRDFGGNADGGGR